MINKKRNAFVPILSAVAIFSIACFVSSPADATVLTVNVTGTFGDVIGTYAAIHSPGDAVTATFVYETDESLGGPGSQSTPSMNPGHEFSSFYTFTSPPYGASITFPAVPAMFSSAVAGGTAAVVVNDNLAIMGDDVNNYVSDGTYDWIEILGSTASDGPTGNPANGEEWTLAFFADTSWFTDGSLIPETLPATYTPVFLGIDLDANENEIGVAFVNVTSLTVTPAPEPSSAFMVAIGAAGMLLRRRRR